MYEHWFTNRCKTGQYGNHQLHQTQVTSMDKNHLRCYQFFFKRFADLLNSSKIVKSGDHSEECYRQDIQQFFSGISI